jgi:membrane protease YdiL (CAAX protease family)
LEKLLKFIRSVLPADRTQLVFLFGIVCLIASTHLRWWPINTTSLFASSPVQTPSLDDESMAAWGHILGVALIPILLGYAGGIFVCFWPGRHTVARVSLGVLLPTTAGLFVICQRYTAFLGPQSSIFLSRNARLHGGFNWAPVELWNLGPGIHVCLLGIILILIFMSRLAFGISSLPIALPSNGASSTEADSLWRRTKLLIYFNVIPSWVLISLVAAVAMLTFQSIFSRSTGRQISLWNFWGTEFLVQGGLIGIAMWISGTEGRRTVGRALRWCRPEYLALGAIFSFGLESLVPTGQYLYKYIYWGAHNYGRLAPPHLDDYFDVPRHSLRFVTTIAFAAFAEEIIFRAILQPRLIRRYGIWRGLFLVGIIWSAFHFYTDFNVQMTELSALLTLVQRIFVCLTLGFAFGWLALRTQSIWPAVVSHASHNILVDSGATSHFAGEGAVLMALWALLTYALYRYWPVPGDSTAEIIHESRVGPLEPGQA